MATSTLVAIPVWSLVKKYHVKLNDPLLLFKDENVSVKQKSVMIVTIKVRRTRTI